MFERNGKFTNETISLLQSKDSKQSNTSQNDTNLNITCLLNWDRGSRLICWKNWPNTKSRIVKQLSCSDELNVICICHNCNILFNIQIYIKLNKTYVPIYDHIISVVGLKFWYRRQLTSCNSIIRSKKRNTWLKLINKNQNKKPELYLHWNVVVSQMFML